MDFKIILDPSGFPLIDLPELNFAIHWLPVTKIQIEYFLTVVNDSKYDQAWYEHLLSKYGERVSPSSARTSDYWNLFITGILPAEAQRFSQYCGRGYDLPTAAEWRDAFRILSNINASQEYLESVLETTNLRERTQRLIKKVESITSSESSQLDSPRKLADQMLMRLGIMEYVYEDDQRNTFAGFGQPSRGLGGILISPRDGIPQKLTNRTEGLRLKQYGFRLIKRKGS